MTKKGCWIVRGDVTDPDAYGRYLAANAAAFKKYGAHFLVRGGASTVVEGAGRDRNVIIAFPSYDEALACYRSSEYQQAMTHRAGAATIDIVVVEGYDGPQPA